MRKKEMRERILILEWELKHTKKRLLILEDKLGLPIPPKLPPNRIHNAYS